MKSNFSDASNNTKESYITSESAGSVVLYPIFNNININRYAEISDYVSAGSYPANYSKNEKRSLIVDISLYLRNKMK